MFPTVATLMPTIQRHRPSQVRIQSGPEQMPSLFVRVIKCILFALLPIGSDLGQGKVEVFCLCFQQRWDYFLCPSWLCTCTAGETIGGSTDWFSKQNGTT